MSEAAWTYTDLSTLGMSGAFCGTGWIFFIRDNAGELLQVYPTIDGEMSFDTTRDVRRSISGQVLLPTEFDKFDTSAREMYVFLVQAGSVYSMGVFLMAELSRQVEAIMDPDNPTEVADLVHVSWADRMIRMRANDGSAQFLYAGADPSYEMIQLLTEAGLPHSISNAVSITAANISWDGSATLYDKITSLAELAGHRPPWPDNNGVIRSVYSTLDPYEVISLESLLPVEGTIMITDSYLNAPNRVIVTDSSGTGGYPISGVWNAPSSAPHSEVNRGWVQTLVEGQQGLRTSDHAEEVARTIGESYAGRTLNCDLAVPTDQLDGPVFLNYGDANWLLTSWSVGLGPNQPMRIQAVEFFGSAHTNDVGRAVA